VQPSSVVNAHAHHRPLIFHDPPDADGGVSHSPERAAIGAHGDPAVLPRLIAVAARSSRLSAALRLHGRSRRAHELGKPSVRGGSESLRCA
jgi:hypothetical protein